MRIIYCDNVLDTQVIESDYEEEKKSAIKAGFDVSLISFKELTAGNIGKATRFVREPKTMELGIYRGWMLTFKQYQGFFAELLKKNIKLINAPIQYAHCHYLPDSYDKIKSKTPKSNWTAIIDPTIISLLAAEFGTNPIIVKDFVKSEKHHWEEACFIPNASDQKQIKSVVNRFLELRGESLNKGIVFRQFEELEFLTKHSKSGIPLTMEFRLFFANKKLIEVYNYWDEGEYGDTKPELEEFLQIAQEIESTFFTMDIAQKQSGEWIIMELGDAQVAGLPANADKDEFYKKLKENAHSKACKSDQTNQFSKSY
ncbi:ATP-grasp domain-containing protein [bacterium]|nr:ATP-grasp domain-containing protein [bacterium]